ncbi:MAG: AAA family ATPase [Candidatus Krumholzibacteriia bacterium]
MIRHVYVDGFKSLIDFSLSIQPGLNVLVGPNGSGKTNIVSFFEFFGHALNNGASRAVSLSGGGGAVFSKKPDGNYRRDFRATIRGDIPLSKKKYIFYIYDFTISMCQEAPAIRFDEQRIRIKYRTVPYRDEAIVDDFHVDFLYSFSSDSSIDASVVSIKALDRKRMRKNSPIVNRLDSDSDIARFIEQMIDIDGCIIDSLSLLIPRQEWRLLHRDLAGAAPYNIIPTVARSPEDSSRSPGIDSDGRGLQSTIYALQNIPRGRHTPRRFFNFYDVEHTNIGVSRDRWLRTVRLANESIVNIKAESEPLDNTIKVSVVIATGPENEIELPLSAMSDGTIKWLALTIVVLATHRFLSIEEPENYLHPLMQTEIIKLLRSSSEKNIFALVTTHSETILNCLDPNEVVVVTLSDGKTRAARPTNAELLRDEISATGFGLGYFYLAGSIENE